MDDRQSERLNASSPCRSPDDDNKLPHADFINTIEADPEPNPDAGDGYESDSLSAGSTSLASTIQRNYVFENNRRYHKFQEGRYLLPNDDVEQSREDMKHYMIMLLCDDNLHFAPLNHPQKVVDIGTGTGIWAIEMGDRFPGAEIVGTDLSPIQPTWVPPNVRFYVEDAEADWLEENESLDFVHARHMCMAVKDWPRLLSQAYRSLKPGGWIELQDLHLSVQCDDETMRDDYVFSDFLLKLKQGFDALGYDLLSLEKYRMWLADAGFVNIKKKVWKVPVGKWPKEAVMKNVGMYNQCVLADALQGVSLGPYTRGLSWTAAEVEVYLTHVRKSLADTSVHSYYTFHVVYGQKPG